PLPSQDFDRLARCSEAQPANRVHHLRRRELGLADGGLFENHEKLALQGASCARGALSQAIRELVGNVLDRNVHGHRSPPKQIYYRSTHRKSQPHPNTMAPATRPAATSSAMIPQPPGRS